MAHFIKFFRSLISEFQIEQISIVGILLEHSQNDKERQ